VAHHLVDEQLDVVRVGKPGEGQRPGTRPARRRDYLAAGRGLHEGDGLTVALELAGDPSRAK